MAWTAPKVWNVGDPATSTELNTYIRDNLNYLRGDLTWTRFTYVNAWTDYSYPAFDPGSYIRKGNYVFLRGLIANGTVNTICTTLPAGYIPFRLRYFMTWGYATSGCSIDVLVNTNGQITIGTGQAYSGSVLYITLNDLSFEMDGV